jgi:ATP-dependent Clp protease ATP-binding subunit ClpA
MNLSKWGALRQCSSAGMARYTKKAESVVLRAYDIASRCGAQEIRPEHLLLRIIASDKPLANRLSLPSADRIVSAFNVKECEEHADSRPRLSEAARLVMACAADERERLGHVHTGTEHLLLGIIRARGSVADFLHRNEITAEGVLQRVIHRNSTGSLNGVEPAVA